MNFCLQSDLPERWFFSCEFYFLFLIIRLDNTNREISINTVTVIFVPIFPNFGRMTQGRSHR